MNLCVTNDILTEIPNFPKAAIIRSHKDTAHTKAERNILEAVKVCFKFVLK